MQHSRCRLLSFRSCTRAEGIFCFTRTVWSVIVLFETRFRGIAMIYNKISIFRHILCFIKFAGLRARFNFPNVTAGADSGWLTMKLKRSTVNYMIFCGLGCPGVWDVHVVLSEGHPLPRCYPCKRKSHGGRGWGECSNTTARRSLWKYTHARTGRSQGAPSNRTGAKRAPAFPRTRSRNTSVRAVRALSNLENFLYGNAMLKLCHSSREWHSDVGPLLSRPRFPTPVRLFFLFFERSSFYN